MAMYDSTIKHLKHMSTLEEILSFTDVLPSVTIIGWKAEFAPVILSQYTSPNASMKQLVKENGMPRNYIVLTSTASTPLHRN